MRQLDNARLAHTSAARATIAEACRDHARTDNRPARDPVVQFALVVLEFDSRLLELAGARATLNDTTEMDGQRTAPARTAGPLAVRKDARSPGGLPIDPEHSALLVSGQSGRWAAVARIGVDR